MLEHLAAEAPILQARLVDIDWSLPIMLGLFLVFAFFFTRIITRPLMKSHEVRYQRMDGARDEASKAELRAAETRLKYEQLSTEARQTAVEVREAIRRDAAEAARALIDDVRGATDAHVAEGQGSLQASADRARAEMAVHVEELSTTLSRKLVAGGKA